MSTLLFSTIDVTRQVFYRTSRTFAFVNLKPVLKGHVLVAPLRPVKRVSDLLPDELTSLALSVQAVGRVIERAYGAQALSIVCQDGETAGQSIPHVHFHILPRKLEGDPFAQRNDDIYPALDRSEANMHTEGDLQPRVRVDDHRQPRTVEDMAKEAIWLKSFFDEESKTSYSS